MSESDDFVTTEKVLHFKQGIPEYVQTVINNEKENNQNIDEEDKEEEIEEEV